MKDHFFVLMDPGTTIPRFKVWPIEGRGARKWIDACCAQEAAERWAETYDAGAGNNGIVNGAPVSLRVKAEDGSLTDFLVRGKRVPSYTARALKG